MSEFSLSSEKPSWWMVDAASGKRWKGSGLCFPFKACVCQQHPQAWKQYTDGANVSISSTWNTQAHCPGTGPWHQDTLRLKVSSLLNFFIVKLKSLPGRHYSSFFLLDDPPSIAGGRRRSLRMQKRVEWRFWSSSLSWKNCLAGNNKWLIRGWDSILQRNMNPLLLSNVFSTRSKMARHKVSTNDKNGVQ